MEYIFEDVDFEEEEVDEVNGVEEFEFESEEEESESEGKFKLKFGDMVGVFLIFCYILWLII